MTPDKHKALHRRWNEIDQELSGLADGRVLPGDTDPATREGELLEELDAIEYDLGLDYFENGRQSDS